jgi:hypothetical protein
VFASQKLYIYLGFYCCCGKLIYVIVYIVCGVRNIHGKDEKKYTNLVEEIEVIVPCMGCMNEGNDIIKMIRK